MKQGINLIFCLGLCVLSACKSTHEDVVKEQKEAQHEIGEAQDKASEVEKRALKKVEEQRAAGDAAGIEDKKIEATEEIAKAEKKVEDEKIEATKEITDSQKAAGESTGSYKRE